MGAKSKTFSGGFSFRGFEGRPRNEIIELQIPPKVLIPLKQGFGDETKPVVQPGEYIKAGQIIGISEDRISNPVHSSVNGVVETIGKITFFCNDINTVTIKPDGTTDWKLLEQHSPDWTNLPVKVIEKLLYLSGAASSGKGGIPTGHKSSAVLPGEVENLIVHGTGSEPFNLSLSLLFQGGRLQDFIEGLKILKTVMPKASVHLALNKDEEKWIEEIHKLTDGINWIEIYSLTPKYPQGFDEMLIYSVLGKKPAYGFSATCTDVVILDIQAVLHVRDAVVEGKPVIERIVGLGGAGWKENIHLKVRVGTPVEYITAQFLKEEGIYRLVFDSLLTNKAVTDFSLPIARTISQLAAVPENTNREMLSFLRAGFDRYSFSKSFLSALAPDSGKICNTNIHGEERPCISCGYCEEACPAGIIPHLLDKYIVNNIIDEKLIDYGIFNCIECNLCSFVCPSKIHLAKHIMEGREKLTANVCE